MKLSEALDPEARDACCDPTESAECGQRARWLLRIRLFFGPLPLVRVALALRFQIWYPIIRSKRAELGKLLRST